MQASLRQNGADQLAPMMTNNIRRILAGLLVAGACVCVSETAAQPGRGLFVEPRMQTTSLLGE